VVAAGAPERGEERVPGDDVTVRHGVEHPARRGDIARAGEGADALVVAEEAAGGEGGGATEREHAEFGGECKPNSSQVKLPPIDSIHPFKSASLIFFFKI